MWELLKSGLRFTIHELGYRSIARKYRGRTMVPATAFVANLRLAALVRNIPGDIVECGTWRGGMSAGMADVLGPDRHYRLFDSYEGMPAAQPIDGAAAMAWEKNTSAPEYHNKCRASEAEARQSMASPEQSTFPLSRVGSTIPFLKLKSAPLLYCVSTPTGTTPRFRFSKTSPTWSFREEFSSSTTMECLKDAPKPSTNGPPRKLG
jgi:hypothetical protein